MRDIKFSDVVSLLVSLGIQTGDGLLVHSAVQFLGRPQGGVAMYYQALQHVLQLEDDQPASNIHIENQNGSHISSGGTLAVPAFNFAFARGEAYNPKTTPSEGMGAFSEYVRQHPGALRTPHPMQSLAVIGRWAKDLASRDTPSAFDPGSAFERMLELDFRLLLLGADIQAVSMVHYNEQRATVPYRYWKEFRGQICQSSLSQEGILETGNTRKENTSPGQVDCWEERTYRMYVRDLELDPQLDLSPIQNELQKRGQWSSISFNYGQVSTCRLVDFDAVTDELLESDPWCLVSKRDSMEF